MQNCYSERKTSDQGYFSSQLPNAKSMRYRNAKVNSGQYQKLKYHFEQFFKISLKHLHITKYVFTPPLKIENDFSKENTFIQQALNLQLHIHREIIPAILMLHSTCSNS